MISEIATRSLNIAGTPPSRRMRAFKKLTPEHLRIISLFLQGKSRTVIASLLEIPITRIGVILRNPAAQKLINEALVNVQSEISALQGPALEVVRDRMEDSEEPGLQLRAADMVVKMNHLYDDDHSAKVTAEDVVAKLIQKRRELHIKSDGPVDISIIEGEQSCEVG